MKKTFYIKQSKPFLPVFQTIIAMLALDHWNAPSWLWGAVGLLMLLIWIVSIAQFATSESIDIEEITKLLPEKKKKSRFQEKMDELLKGNK